MKKRKFGWKVYFFILTFLIVPTYFDEIKNGPTIYEVADIIISLIALLGLFGYSFQKKIYEKKLWKIWFAVIILWDLTLNLLLTHTLGVTQSDCELSFVEHIPAYLIILPEYIALYLYGYRSIDLWENHNNAINSDAHIRNLC